MSAWEEVQYGFNERIRLHLASVPSSIWDRAQEIRLRMGAPVSLTIGSVSWLWNGTGLVGPADPCPGFRVGQSDLDEVLDRLSEGAIYSHEEQIRSGYITMRNGHRAGLCGSFTEDNHHLYRLSSINIRLARDVVGCASALRHHLGKAPVSALIVGAPGSGKTTILRDLIRQYSLCGLRVGVADERGELYAGGAFDLGCCADVISSMSKEKAIACLIRCMNPQIVALDELGDHGAALNACLLAGVRVLTTLHADSREQAERRLQALGIDAGTFDVMVLLSAEHVGQIRQMEWLHDLAEVGGDPADRLDPLGRRAV